MPMPRLRVYSIITLVAVVLLGASSAPARAFRVAIIGAGIGGASVAHHLRTSPHIHTTIFDPHPGGRTLTTSFGPTKQRVDLGASIFVTDNKMLLGWAKEFQLNVTWTPQSDGSFEDVEGLWDGKGFRWVMEPFSWWDPRGWWYRVRLGWRYGLTTLSQVQDIVQPVLDDFGRIYGINWANMEELALKMKYQHLLNTTAREYLVNVKGVNTAFVDEVVNAATRVNYGIDVGEIHALAGLISLAPMMSRVLAFRDGNQAVTEALLENSAAMLVRDRVKTLERVYHGVAATSCNAKFVVQDHVRQHSICVPRPKFRIVTASGIESDETYDAVVVAAPVHATGINATFGRWDDFAPRITYKELHVTFVRAMLNATYFGYDEAERSRLPTEVLTVGDSNPGFRSIGMQSRSANGMGTFKLFSDDPLSDDALNRLFVRMKSAETIRKVWRSYPMMTPENASNLEARRVEVVPGVWYVNSFEPLIATMETEAISGRNIADLVKEYSVIRGDMGEL